VRRRKLRRSGWAPVLVLGLVSCVFVATYSLWYPGLSAESALVAAVDLPASAQPLQPPTPPARTHTVEDLRSRLLGISETYAGTQAAVIFDSYSGETASLNADRRFVAASLSKLSVLLVLYRGAAHGEVNLEEEISMRPSDVWAHGTGVLYRYPVGYTMTLRECAGFMIKESDNTAELMLNRYLGKERIEAELHRLGADSTTYWEPANTTTPNDVLLVLKTIADPSYTTPELSAEMLDLMTNTSFEGRLPQPLPEGTRIAHKIGSYGDTFSDAGIVFPEEEGGSEQEYYVVVFSEGAPGGEANGAIRDISLAAYRTLSG
jgi:beta-lactamase class A